MTYSVLGVEGDVSRGLATYQECPGQTANQSTTLLYTGKTQQRSSMQEVDYTRGLESFTTEHEGSDGHRIRDRQ